MSDSIFDDVAKLTEGPPAMPKAAFPIAPEEAADRIERTKPEEDDKNEIEQLPKDIEPLPQDDVKITFDGTKASLR
eukprot:6945971-Pyramimonas_sp.AAC.1